MTALEAVDEGTNYGLIGHGVDRGGVTGGSEEVSIGGGLGRGGDAVLCTEASDVPLHGVGHMARGVVFDGLAQVRG